MTPKSVGAKLCGAQLAPGHDARRAKGAAGIAVGCGPWGRLLGTAGQCPSTCTSRSHGRARAEPAPETLGGRKEKNKAKNNNHHESKSTTSP